MKSHAKASPGSPTQRQAGLGVLWSIVSVCALAMVAFFAASSSAIAAECPNEEIREEQGVGYLPDCMALEMVSPPRGLQQSHYAITSKEQL